MSGYEHTTTLRLTSGDASRAGRLLRDGRLVVFPTETVYGLGADATNETAVRAVFAAKCRPADNPLICHFPSVEAAMAFLETHPAPEVAPRQTEPTAGGSGVRSLVDRKSELSRLLETFAPGPLTVVVPAPPVISEVARGGLPTVAIRIPNHDIAREILQEAGRPIAAPSANRSGRPSPTTFEMAWAEMAGRVGAIVDGGACPVGLESTVLDVTGDPWCVLRPGVITASAIERQTGVRTLGPTDPAPADNFVTSTVDHNDEITPTTSPGTRYRHYQPTVPIITFETARVVSSALLSPRCKDVLVMGLERDLYVLRARPVCPGLILNTYDSWEHYGRELFLALVQAEEAHVPVIYAQVPPVDVDQPAIRDRLLRAATDWL